MHINRKDVYLVLDNIRSRENVGSIFRTADAVGVSKIYLCGITPVPSTGNSKSQITNHKQTLNSKFQIQNVDKIHKTALGAETYVPWEYRAKTWQVLRELKVESLKFKVVGLEQTKNSKNIFRGSRGLTSVGLRLNLNQKIALVVGNEVRGISPKILKYCDEVVHIPMYGKKESLNVSVAAGVALYIIKERDL